MKLRTLRVGDAFVVKEGYRKGTYIAIALTADPFEVHCLDVNTHALVELEEAEDVEKIPNWKLVRSNTRGSRGAELEVL